MWFTETAWPPMILMLTFAIISGSYWVRHRQLRYLLIAAGLMIAVVIAWYVEQAIVTDAEQVTACLRGVADAFVNRDLDATRSYFADDLHKEVNSAFALVERVENLRLTDVQLQILAQDSRAHTHFRANGIVTVKGPLNLGHHPSRWELTWQKGGGRWQIIRVQRLHPLTGESMGMFAPQ